MDTVERLAAIEEIKLVKARYCRAIDTQEWELFRSLFTEDAVVDLSHTKGAEVTGNRTRNGVDEIVGFISKAVNPGSSSAHRSVMGEVDVTSPTTAEAIWAGQWDAWFAPGGPLQERHGHGYYYESYVKLDGTWRIKHLRIDSIIREEVH